MSLITIIQLLYLAAYAAVHSLLASLFFKKLVWRVFGPSMDRWYFRLFGIFVALSLVPQVLLLLLFHGEVYYIVPSPWRWLMVAGQILAGYTTIRAFTDAPHRFTISQQLHEADRHEPLQPRGLYCFVRDPFLLSGLVQIWLTPFMTANLLLIYILTSVYLYLGSLHWEKRLLFQFGKEYEDYMKKMPRMIPWKGRRRPGDR